MIMHRPKRGAGLAHEVAHARHVAACHVECANCFEGSALLRCEWGFFGHQSIVPENRDPSKGSGGKPLELQAKVRIFWREETFRLS